MHGATIISLAVVGSIVFDTVHYVMLDVPMESSVAIFEHLKVHRTLSCDKYCSSWPVRT